MKIVFIAANEFHPWGGSEYLWAGAAERLARQGIEVSASFNDWGKPVKQVEELRAAGCRIFKRPTPSLARRAVRKLPPFREYPRRHLAKIAAGADLVVISQSMNTDGLPWMEAARSRGLAYAVISQTAAESWWPDDDAAERLAAAYEAASAAYFVSDANLAMSRRQFVAPLRNARIVRNPFNVRYDARPEWPAADSAEFSLACVGRLDVVQKAQDILLQVLTLPRWRERNIRVSLFGTGVNERGLRRLAENLSLSCVQFCGFAKNIEDIWRQHHALILPSRHEGLPLALVEAMLCGRPAIITDVAGARELVRDNVNGFLAKAPTVELLDEAMNRAWENRHRLKVMGQQAAIDVRKFVPPDPVEDFVRELLALVESPAPSSVQLPASSLQKVRP
jgi:glycosyltransferase involved in cell wall biosynthesis